ncbi:hypothetical protein [Kitasatospora sp. NPDC093679]|uniref:hypothetical protein n=1 Tax=Kitasatospora sp. NPDC093679 TaxID=3154983 RepID=UPI003426E0A9
MDHVTAVTLADARDGGEDLRIGGQNGALQWNRESDDATLPVQSPPRARPRSPAEPVRSALIRSRCTRRAARSGRRPGPRPSTRTAGRAGPSAGPPPG